MNGSNADPGKPRSRRYPEPRTSRSAPYVGASAFAHKAAQRQCDLKDLTTYEHIPLEAAAMPASTRQPISRAIQPAAAAG